VRRERQTERTRVIRRKPGEGIIEEPLETGRHIREGGRCPFLCRRTEDRSYA